MPRAVAAAAETRADGSRSWRRSTGSALLAVTLFVAAACADAGAVDDSRTKLVGIEDLAEPFDAGLGSPRLVLLLSPT